MSRVRNPLTLDAGAGVRVQFTWHRGYRDVEIAWKTADGVKIRGVRGPWRRESIARCDQQVREATLSAVRSGLAPDWATGPVEIREAGHKPALQEVAP